MKKNQIYLTNDEWKLVVFLMGGVHITAEQPQDLWAFCQ